MPTRGTGAARYYAETVLGGPTRQAQSSVNVVATTTQIVQNSPDRVNLAIINNGAFDIFLQLTPTGAPTTGIRLGASGGNITFTIIEDFELVGQQWFGISVGGGTLVTAIEAIADLILPPENKAGT